MAEHANDSVGNGNERRMGELARFIVEGNKRKRSGRTALFFPPQNGALSVYTADGSVTCEDLKEAGVHVAQLRGKDKLYGWVYTCRKIAERLGLKIELDDEGPSFGNSRHVNIVGWPNGDQERIDIAQELSQGKRPPCILSPPLAVPLS